MNETYRKNVLADIAANLDSIRDFQFDMTENMKAAASSELGGRMRTLYNILLVYQENAGDAEFRENNLKLVTGIREETGGKIIALREQIGAATEKASLLKSQAGLDEKVSGLQSMLENYQLAVYVYAFAEYLEVVLKEDFAEESLDRTAENMREQDKRYRSTYTRAYLAIKQEAGTTAGSRIIAGMAAVSKKAGEALGKIPGISKGPVDEALTNAGDRLAAYGDSMTASSADAIAAVRQTAVQLFLDRVEALKEAVRQP